jgi:hypothetical protein
MKKKVSKPEGVTEPVQSIKRDMYLVSKAYIYKPIKSIKEGLECLDKLDDVVEYVNRNNLLWGEYDQYIVPRIFYANKVGSNHFEYCFTIKQIVPTVGGDFESIKLQLESFKTFLEKTYLKAEISFEIDYKMN